MSGGIKTTGGFTIIELIIVMAISGILVLSAFDLMFNRINQSTFDQGIRQIQSQIQQTISKVSDGDYPYFNNFTCGDASVNAPVTITNSASPNDQGENLGCVYGGMAIAFMSPISANSNVFATYTLAGRQCTINTTPPLCPNSTSIQDLQPVALAPGATVNTSLNNNTVWTALQGGITAQWISGQGCAPGQDGTQLAFVTFPANAQSVDLYATCSLNLGSSYPSDGAAVDNIDNNLSAATAIQQASICFGSGGTDQSGEITIYYGSGQLETSLRIFSGSTVCA